MSKNGKAPKSLQKQMEDQLTENKTFQNLPPEEKEEVRETMRMIVGAIEQADSPAEAIANLASAFDISTGPCPLAARVIAVLKRAKSESCDDHDAVIDALTPLIATSEGWEDEDIFSERIYAVDKASLYLVSHALNHFHKEKDYESLASDIESITTINQLIGARAHVKLAEAWEKQLSDLQKEMEE